MERGSKITKYVERELINHSHLLHPHIVQVLSATDAACQIASAAQVSARVSCGDSRLASCTAPVVSGCQQSPSSPCTRLDCAVLQFREVFLTPDYLGIAMEYAAGGDMFQHVTNKRGLSEDEARWFFQQLILGLDYCHKMVCGPGHICLRMSRISCMPTPAERLSMLGPIWDGSCLLCAGCREPGHQAGEHAAGRQPSAAAEDLRLWLLEARKGQPAKVESRHPRLHRLVVCDTCVLQMQGQPQRLAGAHQACVVLQPRRSSPTKSITTASRQTCGQRASCCTSCSSASESTLRSGGQFHMHLHRRGLTSMSSNIMTLLNSSNTIVTCQAAVFASGTHSSGPQTETTTDASRRSCSAS